MPAPGAHPVHAVLLAAGASRRFGDDNKLLSEIGGTALVRRVAGRVLAAPVAGLTVVTGHEAERVEAALEGLGAQFTHNPDYAEGLAASLRTGIAAVPGVAAGAMIVLADMAGVTPDLVARLVAAFEQAGGAKIVFPVDAGGAQRNPVIWPRCYFAELRALEGDAGAKGLISGHGDATVPVSVDDETLFADVDTPGDLKSWSG